MCPSLQTWTGWSWTSALTTSCSRVEKSDSCRCWKLAVFCETIDVCYDKNSMISTAELSPRHPDAAGNSELETLGITWWSDLKCAAVKDSPEIWVQKKSTGVTARKAWRARALTLRLWFTAKRLSHQCGAPSTGNLATYGFMWIARRNVGFMLDMWYVYILYNSWSILRWGYTRYKRYKPATITRGAPSRWILRLVFQSSASPQKLGWVISTEIVGAILYPPFFIDSTTIFDLLYAETWNFLRIFKSWYHQIIWIQKILQRKKRTWTHVDLEDRWSFTIDEDVPLITDLEGWTSALTTTTPCSRGEKSDSCHSCFLRGQSMSAMIRIQWFPLLNYHQGILMYAAGNSELETLGQLDEATWNVPQSRIHQKFGCRKNRQVSRRGKRGEHGPWPLRLWFLQRNMLLLCEIIFVQRMYGCLVHGWRVWFRFQRFQLFCQDVSGKLLRWALYGGVWCSSCAGVAQNNSQQSRGASFHHGLWPMPGREARIPGLSLARRSKHRAQSRFVTCRDYGRAFNRLWPIGKWQPQGWKCGMIDMLPPRRKCLTGRNGIVPLAKTCRRQRVTELGYWWEAGNGMVLRYRSSNRRFRFSDTGL